jgi:hypothetical protein
LTTGWSQGGIDFQSFRMEKESCAISPSSLLKRVAYSLSSHDVRDKDRRWFARVFCSWCTWVCWSKKYLFTFWYFSPSQN